MDLQEGIAERDRMLATVQADCNQMVSTRDVELSDLRDRLGLLQHAFNMTPSERLKRFWQRLTGAAPAKRDH